MKGPDVPWYEDVEDRQAERQLVTTRSKLNSRAALVRVDRNLALQVLFIECW